MLQTRAEQHCSHFADRQLFCRTTVFCQPAAFRRLAVFLPTRRFLRPATFCRPAAFFAEPILLTYFAERQLFWRLPGYFPTGSVFTDRHLLCQLAVFSPVSFFAGRFFRWSPAFLLTSCLFSDRRKLLLLIPSDDRPNGLH
jgi:hypothetical protein